MPTVQHIASFEQLTSQMRLHKMPLPAERFHFRIEDARNVLKQYLGYFLSLTGEQLQWLPEYEKVADWLSDNKGKGLFLYGNCGRGKSLITRYVIPAVLLSYMGKVAGVYDVCRMNSKLDEVLAKNILCLDDIGTEEMIVNYGERRLAFAEIMDAAEKQGKLVVVSSNLTVEQISRQYGDRVLDRIKSCTTRILFRGESLRQ
ncbi:hypothetical protein [Dysgonomonas macrotermitis]|uniref:DNA replication protein DnaC n=1 Tax=Dysgonomonas macrotermitis TaxID=1346286 RepID=A0A1M5AR60_9BACT|nr:hypothetical protein [Dysgonomonas macrotermitis]SHF32720.1 DNA replication protein DnaC [Dysgonomonas macrotermitis]